MVTSASPNPVSQVLATFYGAFSRQDLAALRLAVSPDWQDSPAMPGQTVGPDGIAPVFALLGGAFSDFHIEVLDWLAAPEEGGPGQRVAVRARMSGLHTGQLMGAAASQRRFDIALHEFHRMEAGRITHTWHLEDWLSFSQQTGAAIYP